MYKLMAGVLLFLYAGYFYYTGKPEISLGDFYFVVSVALMGAGADTMESKKK